MKKIFAIILAILVLGSQFSACTQNDNQQVSDAAATENNTNTETTPQEEQTASTYTPGNWTTTGYTSQWLNMSFAPAPYFTVSARTIEITKDYNNATTASGSGDYIEMEFHWADRDDTSVPIMLTVEPITDTTKDLFTYAIEDFSDIQDTFREYNLSYQHLERDERTVTFLGEEYLRAYHAYATSVKERKTTERYTFYRIKDNHLIRLTFLEDVSTMDLGLFLSCFSTLDGTIRGDQGLEEDANKLFGTLDYNTVWSFVWTTDRESYTVSLGFEEDGSCYYLLHDFEIYEGGKGTYKVDDNMLSMTITVRGKKANGKFRFDSAKSTLYVASEQNFLGKSGDCFYLENVAEFDFEQLKNWGASFAKR